MSGRRGFTLIEVMIALVVGALLAALVFDTVLRVHQVGRGRAERAGLAAALRNGVLPIAAELAPAGSDSIGGSDLGALSASSLVVRANRGLWAVCGLALPDTVIVAEPGAGGWSLRLPAPGRDSLLLYAAGDSSTRVDGWLPLPLAAGPFAGSCPGGGAGWRLVSAVDSGVVRARGVAVPSVLRVFEVVGYRLYGSGATWQVGQEGLSAGATIQPLAGPLSAGSLGFTGLDRALSPTSASAVGTVRIRLVGRTHRETAVGPGVARPALDSVEWLLPLRNVP